jgi:hypothetical protein
MNVPPGPAAPVLELGDARSSGVSCNYLRVMCCITPDIATCKPAPAESLTWLASSPSSSTARS